METLTGGSEHKSEASSVSTGNSQHGPRKSRRRRKKGGKVSNHGVNKVDNGETPMIPPGMSQQGGGSAKKNRQKVNPQKSRSKSPKGPGSHHRQKPKPPPDMTVIVNSVYLWDVAKKHADEDAYQAQHESYHQLHHRYGNHQQVAPYHFAPDVLSWNGELATKTPDACTVNTVRAPHDASACRQHVSSLDRWVCILLTPPLGGHLICHSSHIYRLTLTMVDSVSLIRAFQILIHHRWCMISIGVSVDVSFHVLIWACNSTRKDGFLSRRKSLPIM